MSVVPIHSEAQHQVISGLLAIASQAEVYHLVIEVNGRTITVSIGQPASQAPNAGRQFSRLERTLLAAIGPEWISAEKIAEKAGERLCDGLRSLLSNLVDLGAIESAPGRGYRRSAAIHG